MSDISIFNEDDLYYLLGICSLGVGFLLTIALVILNYFTNSQKKFSYYILMYCIYSILSFAAVCILNAFKLL
ncbi:MAG: hypothetical protein LBE92_10200 [Chryseobacterium sp.]|jgi:hypothetical protein|uniref:hypothetical protein n=1 Tax=Chryseobacterium sp. TaxID=1871047 RepID=UPI002825ADE0|nr:hypothetical protein [Chryseobacterium sp.]MDR2236486.1 hypothetical protein [Chryseobacterium sp.]